MTLIGSAECVRVLCCNTVGVWCGQIRVLPVHCVVCSAGRPVAELFIKKQLTELTRCLPVPGMCVALLTVLCSTAANIAFSVLSH